MENKISVIIPAFNASKTILRAVKSVENQTAVNYVGEIIVVDDGSTDDTYDIVKNYSLISSLSIKVITKKNAGVSSARNAGVRLSRFKWIAFLDSDDEWMTNKIELQMNIVHTNNVLFLGGNWTSVPVKVGFKKINSLYSPSVKDLCYTTFPQTSTWIMDRRVFESVGGFSEEMKYGEDGRFLFDSTTKFGVFYSPEQVVVFDGGKRGFGVRGLSAKLKEMHKGWVINLKYLKKNKQISFFFYAFMRVFEFLKYLRRIIISKKIK